MRRALLAVLAAAFLVGLPGCGGESKDANAPGAKPQAAPHQGAYAPPGGAGASTVDVSYITSDFFAAVVVRPQSILRSPALKGLPLEELLAKLHEDMGVDPGKVEQLAMLLQTPAADARPGAMPRPAGIVRFSEPVDLAKLVRPMWPSAVATREGELVYYRDGSGGGLAACAADDRTVVICAESLLKKVLARSGGNNPLAERLRAAGGADLVAAVVVGPVRRVIEETAAGAKDQIPEGLAPFAGMAEQLEAATLSADLSGDPVVRLVLEATGPKPAEEVEKAAQGLVAMANMIYQGQREQMLKQEPRDASKALMAFVDEVMRGIQVVRQGDRVVVTVKRPKGMDTLGKTLAPAIVSGRERAKSDAAKIQIAAISGALDLYRLSVGAYPTTAHGLQSLRTPPPGLARPDQWDGPYLAKDVPLDPWGRPYRYECPGKHNPKEFDLWSQGPDGVSGNGDDVGNWEPKVKPPPLEEGVY